MPQAGECLQPAEALGNGTERCLQAASPPPFTDPEIGWIAPTATLCCIHAIQGIRSGLEKIFSPRLSGDPGRNRNRNSRSPRPGGGHAALQLAGTGLDCGHSSNDGNDHQHRLFRSLRAAAFRTAAQPGQRPRPQLIDDAWGSKGRQMEQRPCGMTNVVLSPRL